MSGMFGATPRNDLLRALYFTPPPKNEQYWRGKTLGSISKPQRSTQQTLGNLLANALTPVSGEKRAQHVANRAVNALTDLTPVGGAVAAEDARRDWNQGNTLGAVFNSGMAALSALPGGAFNRRVFHASPVKDLERILANPPGRQYDNATSQFGAFFAPSAEGAQRYGPNLYEASLSLKRPYEMDWSEFAKFQAIEKAADGSRIPAELWGQRSRELYEEANRFRQELAAAGHDGIIVRGPRGDIKEIASFNDVPLK